MTSKSDLEKMINQIMEKEAPAKTVSSKVDRDILQIERELRDNAISYNFSILVSELIPEKQDEKFGNGTFTREKYSLSWAPFNEGPYRIILTNIEYKNAKVLLECPDLFKNDLASYLDRFISKMAEEIKSLEK